MNRRVPSRAFASIAIAALLACASRGRESRAPVVDPAPAGTLAPEQVLDAVEYAIELRPDFAAKTVDLRVEIDAITLRATNELALHFSGPQTRLTRVDGVDVPARRDGDVLRMQLGAPIGEGERVRIDVAYAGAPGKGMTFTQAAGATDGNPHPALLTDSWPDWTRTWLPCVDHPSDRARVRLTIDGLPDDLVATSNGASLGRSGGEERWSESFRIPSYLIAVAVGPYAVIEQAPLAGAATPIRHFAYRWNERAARVDFAEVPAMLACFERWVGPYPFEKVSMVQVPTRFGGMENAACIFVAEGSVNGAGEVTGTLAHELAHQWFGDAVSIADWPELWLSEGFATYFGARYMNECRAGGDLAREMGAMQSALMLNPLVHERPIVGAPTANLDEMLNALNYQKGACVLHALRRYVGEDAFARGMREHVKRNFDRSIRTSDFAAAFSAGAGVDVTRFLAAWTREPGAPVLDARVDGDRIVVEQVQGGTVFPCRIDVEVTTRRGTHRAEALFETDARCTLEIGGDPPERIVLDPDHWVLHGERRG